MKKLFTILSALTLTSSITSVSVACGEKLEGEPIDIDKITAEEIINVQSEYKYKNIYGKEKTITPDKLGTLENSYVKLLLEANLSSIFMNKLTRIDKTKINDLNEFTIFSNAEFTKFSETERQMIAKFTILKICAITLDVESNSWFSNSGEFNVTIEITDKNEAFKKNITMEQIVENHFNFNKAEKFGISTALGLPITDFEKVIAESVNNYKSVIQTINFNTIKSMYNLIKGKSKIIKINLTK